MLLLQNQHHRIPYQQLPVIYKEINRYLGYYQIQPDDTVKTLIEECLKEMLPLTVPQGIYSVFPITRLQDDDTLNLGFATVTSKNLAHNLTDCTHIILMAATIGPKIDLLIQRYSRLNPTKGVIMQAIGAMLIESYCDCLNEQLRTDFNAQGYWLRPRFSPGYGDFKLEHQKDIFRAIRCDKTIGLTLMDSGIMAPSKSVTAIIGLFQPPEAHGKTQELQSCIKCSDCNKTDCAYRQE